MSVPDFQAWFLPLLKRLNDGEVHQLGDLYEQLADDMKLTEENRSELLPSGKQTTFRNRIGWARTYLKKAGLVESPGRAQCRITPRGKEVPSSGATALSVKYLKKFPEFAAFAAPGSKKKRQPDEDPRLTPEEALENAHQAIKEELLQELLGKLKAAPPSFFEHVVVELLLKMGYGGSREDAGRTLGKSGDGGVDGIIKEDRLGLDVVYIQAKRWENTVGRPIVQAFAGSLEGHRAKKGVLITTSDFQARQRSTWPRSKNELSCSVVQNW